MTKMVSLIKTRTVYTSEQLHDRRNCKKFLSQISRKLVFSKRIYFATSESVTAECQSTCGNGGGWSGGEVGGWQCRRWWRRVSNVTWTEHGIHQIVSGSVGKVHLTTQQTVADVRLRTPPSAAPGESVCQPTLLTARHSPGCQQECQQRSLYYTTHTTEN